LKTISKLLFNRGENPYGIPWEKWASLWYVWMFSIPKKMNPCTDLTGKYCSVEQTHNNVWFLAGTFGNIIPVKRKCVVPVRKAIFFPVLVKEDSFTEDYDLREEHELRRRSKDATDRVLSMEVAIRDADYTGEFRLQTQEIQRYRVKSNVFDLVFPVDNVYDVEAGPTRSVCDGFWIFIRPLEIGKYFISFKGETFLANSFTKNKMKKTDVYAPCNEIIDKDLFRVEVSYELTVGSEID
jgi:hypothetical protein